MGHISFGDRDNENLRKLEVYDRLGSQNEKSSLADRKAQFEQAFKESEQQRKIAATDERLKISQDRTDLLRQQRELQQAASEAKIASMQAEMALQQHKIEATKEVAQQTTGLFTGIEDARDAKGFVSPSAIAKLRAQFPDAAMHANNASALEHEVRRYDEAQKLADAVPKTGSAPFGTTTTTTKGPDGTSVRVAVPNAAPGTPEALKQQHDALQSGLQDSKGNYLSGDELKQQIGKLNAVKAKLGYDLLDPTSGKVLPNSAPVSAPAPGVIPPLVAPVAPTAAATQAAGAALDTPISTPAPVVPVAAPIVDVSTSATPAPADHSAAIGWARSNPNDPRSTTILKLNGL